ncbi:MAG: hypothetical protein ACNA7M_11745, partial [Roseovarius sp.]
MARQDHPSEQGYRPMALRLPHLILITGLVAGCSDLLPLDRSLDKSTRSAAYPDLIPVEDIRSRATTPQITPDTADTLDRRSAGLRARAARLKGGVVDPGTQERMQSGVSD